MTSGHQAELRLRRRPRVRLVELETPREKAQGETGIPSPGIGTEERPVPNRETPSYEIAEQNSKPHAPGPPREPLSSRRICRRGFGRVWGRKRKDVLTSLVSVACFSASPRMKTASVFHLQGSCAFCWYSPCLPVKGGVCARVRVCVGL